MCALVRVTQLCHHSPIPYFKSGSHPILERNLPGISLRLSSYFLDFSTHETVAILTVTRRRRYSYKHTRSIFLPSS